MENSTNSNGTDWSIFFSTLPPIGWVVLIMLIGLCTVLVYGIFRFIEHRNIKFKNLEVTQETQKELYQTEGKNLLDNQCNNANNLLEQVWIRIYEVVQRQNKISDPKDLFILEDICHLIEDKLELYVKNDLTRNHITVKTDLELEHYSDGKAKGYYSKVQSLLYQYNNQLPEINLPAAMNEITMEDYRKIFHDIYFSSREIAGYGGADDDRR